MYLTLFYFSWATNPFLIAIAADILMLLGWLDGWRDLGGSLLGHNDATAAFAIHSDVDA